MVKKNFNLFLFKPETFWYLDVELQHGQSGKTVNAKWSRVHLFDKEVVYLFYNEVRKADKALVTSVSLKDKVKERPAALNTVELLRAASAGLGISPIHAMQLAEKLYTQGYISYPRTETTQYAPNFDFKEVLRDQARSPVWGNFSNQLLSGKLVNPRKGSVSRNSNEKEKKKNNTEEDLNLVCLS